MARRAAGPSHWLLAAVTTVVAYGVAVAPVLCAPANEAIAQVAVRHNYLLSDRQALDLLGVEEGGLLDEGRLDASVDEWNRSGAFGAVSYVTGRTDDGRLTLTVSVIESVHVTAVSFRGNDRISSRRLAEIVAVGPGDRVGEADVRADERRIAAAYARAGYPLVSARGRLAIADRQERQLVFYVGEGPRTYIESVQFEGNDSIPGKDLFAEMDGRPRRWPSWIWPGWYDEAVFREDVRRVEDACRRRGYLDAGAEGDVAFSDDMGRAVLHVRVAEGPLYRVAEVAFEGNTLFRDDELLEAIPLVEGEPYRLGQLGGSAEAISALYADQGFWDVTMEKGNLRPVEYMPAEGTDVRVRFLITEGEPVYVRLVQIRGLTKTREMVIRRNLTFYPGEPARASEFKESERVLANTGYLDRDSRRPARIGLDEAQAGPLRDAIVQVEEGQTGRLMLTAGVGSESGVMGGILVEEDNFDLWNWPSSWDDLLYGNAFRGGGHRLSVLLNAGTERSFYAITFENPAVWNTEYSFAASLYRRGIARNEFDEIRTGLSLTGGERLSRHVRRWVTAGYESIRVEDISSGSPLVITQEKGTHGKGFVRLGASVDRRDSRFLPTEGYYAGGEVEAAAGDVQTIKLDVEGQKYWTVREDRGRNKHVVGVRGRLGLIDSYSGDVPVYERFYAGGIGTLRGFEFEGVSPVHGPTGKQVGGDSMLVGSVEYSLPIADEERLRLVTFCDAGWVSEDVGDVLTGLDELRLSVGVGFRWQIPFLGGASIELDFAAPLMKESGDDTQAFHFSLGAQQRF